LSGGSLVVGNDVPGGHLRILRDLKRIHSLIAALAYPILNQAGQLQNRLVEASIGEPGEG
jgi:hypothetical protein